MCHSVLHPRGRCSAIPGLSHRVGCGFRHLSEFLPDSRLPTLTKTTVLARPPPTLRQSKPLPCFQLGGCVVRWRLEFAALCLEIYDPVLANSSIWSPESKIQIRQSENVKPENMKPELETFRQEALCISVPYPKSKLFTSEA